MKEIKGGNLFFRAISGLICLTLLVSEVPYGFGKSNNVKLDNWIMLGWSLSQK